MDGRLQARTNHTTQGLKACGIKITFLAASSDGGPQARLAIEYVWACEALLRTHELRVNEAGPQFIHGSGTHGHQMYNTQAGNAAQKVQMKSSSPASVPPCALAAPNSEVTIRTQSLHGEASYGTNGVSELTLRPSVSDGSVALVNGGANRLENRGDSTHFRGRACLLALVEHISTRSVARRLASVQLRLHGTADTR